MSDVNLVKLQGRLDKKFDLKTTANSKVLNFKVVTESTTSGGKTVKAYHSVTAWGKEAEAVDAMELGSTISLEARLGYSSYEKDGAKVYKTDVTVTKLLGASRAKSAAPADEDLPF